MKGRVEQEWANRVKILRAAIRLKYSLLADNELNERVEEEKKKFDRAVHDGKLLAPLDPKRVLNG